MIGVNQITSYVCAIASSKKSKRQFLIIFWVLRPHAYVGMYIQIDRYQRHTPPVLPPGNDRPSLNPPRDPITAIR